MSYVYNTQQNKDIRKELRRDQPSTERLLWSKLRNRQLGGYKFRRQFGVGNSIVDFYCPEIKLAIEIDGDSHFSEKARMHDRDRQDKIEYFGIKFLRFTNKDVTENLEGVLQTILKQCGDNNLT